MTELFEVEKLEGDSAICKCAQCQSNYLVKYKSDARKSPIGNLCNECKYFIRDMEITQQNLRKAFNYDPDTGELTHRYTTRSGKVGEDATKSHSGGYRSIRVGNKEMLAHRIIFMYMEGYFPEQVDHINHNRKDNRWANLRDASHIENYKNHSLSKTNTSTINGVALHKPTGKYRAYINKNYKQIHLGLFSTIEEAEKARRKADIQHQYHENHGIQGLE
jgi:hypothetical protein